MTVTMTVTMTKKIRYKYGPLNGLAFQSFSKFNRGVYSFAVFVKNVKVMCKVKHQ